MILMHNPLPFLVGHGRARVDQVVVFTLKEQNRIIGQLRKEANANFMLLDDRSRRTQDLVQKLVTKVSRQTSLRNLFLVPQKVLL